MLKRWLSLPVKIGLGLGFGLVTLTAMLSESQGADDPRASLRVSTLPPTRAGRTASDDQLYRQVGRLRRLVRQQVRADKEDGEQPFARTREEAARKLLENLVQEGDGTIEPPQTSLSSIGLCDEGLRANETASALDAVRPHEHLSRRLSVDWSMAPDEEQGHRALEKTLGRSRYLEVARTCAAKQESTVMHETESAFLLISKELSLAEKTSRKALALLEARNKELSAINPEPLAAIDESGSLAASPARSAQEITALQAKLSAVESRYTGKFKQLIGAEKWRQYQAAMIGAPGTATDLAWAQYLLFREPAAAAAEKQGAPPSARAKQITLIPNKF